MAKRDYAALAASRIHQVGSTKGGPPRKPRLLVYGRNKKGKTRFCSTAPNVLILDPEDGTAYEKAAKPKVWPVDKWDDVVDCYHYLKSGKHNYEWVALDAFTKTYNILLHWLMKVKTDEVNLEDVPKSVRIQSYGQANEMVKGMLHNFHTLTNIGLIITAQERIVDVATMDDIDDDEASSISYQVIPDVPKGARSALNAIVDLTGRLYVVQGDFTRRVKRDGKVIELEENRQRRLWVGVDDRYETGYRSEFVLPDFLENPTVRSVTRAMKEGK